MGTTCTHTHTHTRTHTRAHVDTGAQKLKPEIFILYPHDQNHKMAEDRISKEQKDRNEMRGMHLSFFHYLQFAFSLVGEANESK